MTQTNGSSQASTGHLKVIPVKAFADNYIWLVSNGRQAFVVDPGDANPVLDVLERNQLELTAILLTHHHQDHVGGVKTLVENNNATVFGPANEVLPYCDRHVAEGDSVKLQEFGIELAVLDIPGHTAGHVAYFGRLNGNESVFCGDTLFAGGCGRIFEGTAAQMLASLTKLANLPPETLVYCAHEYTASNLKFAVAAEPDNEMLLGWQQTVQEIRARNEITLPSTIKQELCANPFLRCTQPTITRQVSAWANTPLTSPLEVFTQLRAWKNVYR